jgi:hypothetical protein
MGFGFEFCASIVFPFPVICWRGQGATAINSKNPLPAPITFEPRGGSDPRTPFIPLRCKSYSVTSPGHHAHAHTLGTLSMPLLSGTSNFERGSAFRSLLRFQAQATSPLSETGRWVL